MALRVDLLDALNVGVQIIRLRCARKFKFIYFRSRRSGAGGPEEDIPRRYREGGRSRSPPRFDRPRSPPPTSRFDQSANPSTDSQRSPPGWGHVASSPGRKPSGSYNNDDLRSPSPVAQYYEDM